MSREPAAAAAADDVRISRVDKDDTLAVERQEAECRRWAAEHHARRLYGREQGSAGKGC